jgi:hypothetical protein
MDCIYLFLRQIMSNPFSSALLGKGSRYIDYSQRFVVLIGALMFEMRCLGSDENPAPLGLQVCICKWLSVHHRSWCVFSPNGYQLTEFSILLSKGICSVMIFFVPHTCLPLGLPCLPLFRLLLSSVKGLCSTMTLGVN